MYERLCLNAVYTAPLSRQSPNKNPTQELSNLKSHLLIRYHLTQEQAGRIITEGAGAQVTIPYAAFSLRLSQLEACAVYLRDNLCLRFKDIARLTGRAKTTVTTTYLNAKEKQPVTPKIPEEFLEPAIPAAVIAYRRLSAYEAIVMYLHHERNVSFHDMGRILKRHNRILWHVHGRATKKVAQNLFLKEVRQNIKEVSSQLAPEEQACLITLRKSLQQEGSSALIRKTAEQPCTAGICIPAAILSQGPSPLRSMVRYLHDGLGIPISKIARALNRSASLISISYAKARDSPLVLEDFSHAIPLECFADRKLSALEAAVRFLLEDEHMDAKQAAFQLGRRPSVINAVRRRYHQKLAGGSP